MSFVRYVRPGLATYNLCLSVWNLTVRMLFSFEMDMYVWYYHPLLLPKIICVFFRKQTPNVYPKSGAAAAIWILIFPFRREWVMFANKSFREIILLSNNIWVLTRIIDFSCSRQNNRWFRRVVTRFRMYLNTQEMIAI